MFIRSGRKDACVLWDIRVEDGYKHKGIGQKLFDLCKSGAAEDGYSQMLIETQEMKFHLLCIWIYKLFQMCRDDVMVRYIGIKIRNSQPILYT